jgi:NhaP-type Na+/H+ or K+/H+ antiporter
MGWFGPIAVAAVYYGALMEDKLSEPLIWDITSLVVCASVVVHGLTGSPFTRWYGKHSPGR